MGTSNEQTQGRETITLDAREEISVKDKSLNKAVKISLDTVIHRVYHAQKLELQEKRSSLFVKDKSLNKVVKISLDTVIHRV